MKKVSSPASVHPGDAVFNRRAFLRTGPALAAATLAAPLLPAQAQTSGAPRWCGTWGAAPVGPPPAASTQTWSSQTLRLIVRTSIGGSRVRIRVSNDMGATPLRIGRASIALRASGAAINAASLRVLRFGGQATITLPARTSALSDPVDLAVPAQADLAVSLYLSGSTQGSTLHNLALQTNYVSPGGDYCTATSMPVSRSLASWPFLTEVDVDVEAGVPCLMALGDSITDGQGSTANANRRWPDYLARRLQASLGAARRVGVVNRGITGNFLLKSSPNAPLAGRSALERFDSDVLATSGVRFVVALLGINDIRSASTPPPANDLIAGYRQMITRAHARGVAIIGATLPPYEGFIYYSAAGDRVRRALNDWMRASSEFDGLLDAEAALRDPARRGRMLPAYDSGDHLHPNDAGYQAIANAMPLAPFVTTGLVAGEPAR